MTTITLSLSDIAMERLRLLSRRLGQSADMVLDEALADFEQKLQLQESPLPRALPEAELLDDVGRIRQPSEAARKITARVKATDRRELRAYADGE